MFTKRFIYFEQIPNYKKSNTKISMIYGMSIYLTYKQFKFSVIRSRYL